MRVEREVEIDGIGMGVLSDGTAYLTGRGLAQMCGIDQKVIVRVAASWSGDVGRPREDKIRDLLRQQGLDYARPYIPIDVDGVSHHAFPDAVCMAFLEYYAFDAGPHCKTQAQGNFRLLARKSFREFIYGQVGYKPSNAVPVDWQQFHDRVSLVYDSCPPGYFGVFKEIADLIVTLITNGAVIGSEFIPDISVGIAWSKHWVDKNLDVKFGSRRKYIHEYPEYFPQAGSNPQFPYCYPDAALAEFRRWWREQYLREAFPKYIRSKQSKGELPAPVANRALGAVGMRLLGARKEGQI